MERWEYRRLDVLYTIARKRFEVVQDEDETLEEPDPYTQKYKLPPELMDYLDMIGEDGWELVSMAAYHIPVSRGMFADQSSRYIAILKRPIEE